MVAEGRWSTVPRPGHGRRPEEGCYRPTTTYSLSSTYWSPKRSLLATPIDWFLEDTCWYRKHADRHVIQGQRPRNLRPGNRNEIRVRNPFQIARPAQHEDCEAPASSCKSTWTWGICILDAAIGLQGHCSIRPTEQRSGRAHSTKVVGGRGGRDKGRRATRRGRRSRSRS